MFQKIVFLAIVMMSAVIQVTVFPQFFPAGAVPSLILIMVVFWTIRSGFSENWKKIIVAGLVLDLSYGWAIGINILSLSVVSFLVGALIKRFSMTQKGWGFIMAIGLIGLGTLINDIIIIMIIKTVGWLKGVQLEDSMVSPLGVKIILDAILTSASFILLYWPLNKMEKFIDSYSNKQFAKTRFLK